MTGVLQVSDVYEIYEDSDQCNLSLQIRSIEVSLHWRVFLASGQEGHSAPARTSSFTSGFRNGRHMQNGLQGFGVLGFCLSMVHRVEGWFELLLLENSWAAFGFSARLDKENP